MFYLPSERSYPHGYDLMEGARDDDGAVFQRLPHDLEYVAPEFRQFVKEHDNVMDNDGLTKTDPLLKRQMEVIDFMVVPTGFEPVFPA